MQAPQPGTPPTRDDRLTAARVALSVPERLPATPQELSALAPGALPPLLHEGQRLARWTLGSGPDVVLVHGWSGRSTQWVPWLPALLAAGWRVQLLDLPGHGESTGQEASVVHAGRALRELCAELGTVHAVIGHSMGSAAVLWALRHGVRLNRSVHLAGPSSLTPVVHGIAAAQGLDAADRRAFAGWAEGFIGAPLASVDLPAVSPHLRHPALLLHDPDDRVVPYAASQALQGAWPLARLEPVSGLGHRRILSDEGVIRSAVSFLRTT